jgi:hypothetical protein
MRRYLMEFADFLHFPRFPSYSGGCKNRVHRVVTAAFWRTFNHEGKIIPDWWGGGTHPLSLHLPSPVKLQCTLQLSGQIHEPCFIFSKNVYSVVANAAPIVF